MCPPAGKIPPVTGHSSDLPGMEAEAGEDAGAADADAVAVDPTGRTSTVVDSIAVVVAPAEDSAALSLAPWTIAIATKTAAKTWAIRRALPTSSSAAGEGSVFGGEVVADFSRIFHNR